MCLSGTGSGLMVTLGSVSDEHQGMLTGKQLVVASEREEPPASTNPPAESRWWWPR